MTDRDSIWRLVETFGGDIAGIDEEGYLEVFDPEGNRLVLIHAEQLLAALSATINAPKSKEVK